MAVISAVKIANMALSHIGDNSTIEDLGDTASEQAIQCNLWYDYCRLQVLEAFDWSFARKRETLALHGSDPPSGQWTYRYQYPADAVTIRRLENPAGSDIADQVPFDVETIGGTKSIVTDLEDAKAIYTYDVEDTTMFSAYFVQTLSHLLAAMICFKLTGDKNIKQGEFETFVGMLRRASAYNANEQAAKTPREAAWIEGRA